MLTITLLGTAATMPLPDRALTAAAAECVGHSLLFDCVEGTQAAARRAGAKRLWLVHYSPMITEPEECLHFAQGAFPRAECGFDGKQMTLQFEEEPHG